MAASGLALQGLILTFVVLCTSDHHGHHNGNDNSTLPLVDTVRKLFPTYHSIELRDDGTIIGVQISTERLTIQWLNEALSTVNAESLSEALGLEFGFAHVDPPTLVDFSDIFTNLIVSQVENRINYETAFIFLERFDSSDGLDKITLGALKTISFFIMRAKQLSDAQEPVDMERMLFEAAYDLYIINGRELPQFRDFFDSIEEVIEGDKNAAKEIVSSLDIQHIGIGRLNNEEPINKVQLLHYIIEDIQSRKDHIRCWMEVRERSAP